MEYYVYSSTDDKDFVSFFNLAKYIQENRENIVWNGGFYPRKTDTNYRGAKAFQEIMKAIDMSDFKFGVKCLKLLRKEYFCDVEWVKVSNKEIAEDLFEGKDVYVGTEEKEIQPNYFEDLMNVINETDLESDQWKDIIHNILLKL